MQEKPFPDDVKELLDTAAQVGVVLDFCLLGLDAQEREAAYGHTGDDADKTYRPPEKDHRYLLSRQAASEAMRVFSERREESAGKREPGQNRHAISVEGTPRGETISLHTLLGPEWCTSLRRVALGGKLSSDATDAEQAVASRDHDAWYHARGYDISEGPRGLVGAFFAPPYGLRAAPETPDLERVFTALVEKLFYEHRTPVRCYRWSDDWSTYFNAGREWWGTNYWTSLTLETEEILVIGASASD